PSGRCGTAGWNVSGGYGFGTLNITATNPNPGVDPNCVDWVNYQGSINRPGCHTGNGGWTNSAFDSGDWNWTKPCETSPSEITSSGGWAESEGYPTIQK